LCLKQEFEALQTLAIEFDFSELRYEGSNPSIPAKTGGYSQTGKGINQVCKLNICNKRNVKNGNGNVLDMKTRKSERITGKNVTPKTPSWWGITSFFFRKITL